MTGFGEDDGFGGTATRINTRGYGVDWTYPPPPPPPITVFIKSHLRDRPANLVPVAEAEAEIRWGKASQFQWSVSHPDRIINRTIIRVIPPDDDDEEEELEETIEYTETDRTTETVRVSNPQDAEQYVDVERILTITFQGPNVGASGEIAQYHRFTLNGWT